MKREKDSFNFIDWCILTFAAALIAALAFVFWKQSGKVLPTVEIECLFRLEASDRMQPVSVGDEVRNENGTLTFGRISRVSVRQVKTMFLREDSPVYGDVEGLSELELTVRMAAEKAEEYRVGGVRICAGGVGTYRIGSVLVSGVRTIKLSEVGR